jgi:hypothetical protein
VIQNNLTLIGKLFVYHVKNIFLKLTKRMNIKAIENEESKYDPKRKGRT